MFGFSAFSELPFSELPGSAPPPSFIAKFRRTLSLFGARVGSRQAR